MFFVVTSLPTLAEALRLSAALLPPVMPGTAGKIDALLGHKAEGTWQSQLVWAAGLTGKKLGATAILFPKPQAAA